jgi:hypothetical protein
MAGGGTLMTPYTQRPGTIAVITPETGRYGAFHQCREALERPAGTAVHIRTGGGYSIADDRNRVVEASKGDWIWWLDDDHVFSHGTLMRLLAHFEDDRVDAVVPLCLKRKPPFSPVVLSLNPELTHATQAVVSQDDRGLVEIGAAGGGGMLVRRRVFEAMPAPWFRPHPRNPGGGEDIWFCQEMRRAGFRLFCDFDTPIGHIAPMAIWPSRHDYGFQLQCLTNLTVEHAADISQSFTAGEPVSQAAGEAEALGKVAARLLTQNSGGTVTLIGPCSEREEHGQARTETLLTPSKRLTLPNIFQLPADSRS